MVRLRNFFPARPEIDQPQFQSIPLPQQLKPAYDVLEHSADQCPKRCKLVNAPVEPGEIIGCFVQGAQGFLTTLDASFPLYRSLLNYLAPIFGIGIKLTCHFRHHSLFDYSSYQSYEGKSDRQNDQDWFAGKGGNPSKDCCQTRSTNFDELCPFFDLLCLPNLCGFVLSLPLHLGRCSWYLICCLKIPLSSTTRKSNLGDERLTTSNPSRTSLKFVSTSFARRCASFAGRAMLETKFSKSSNVVILSDIPSQKTTI